MKNAQNKKIVNLLTWKSFIIQLSKFKCEAICRNQVIMDHGRKLDLFCLVIFHLEYLGFYRSPYI